MPAPRTRAGSRAGPNGPAIREHQALPAAAWLVYVRKTDKDDTDDDVRYLKNGCAVAPRQLRRPDHGAAVRGCARSPPTKCLAASTASPSHAGSLRPPSRALKRAGVETLPPFLDRDLILISIEQPLE